jgi:hypothetical protein
MYITEQADPCRHYIRYSMNGRHQPGQCVR